MSSLLHYLTTVDHECHEALIAVDPETGQSFGTARYVRDEDHPDTAVRRLVEKMAGPYEVRSVGFGAMELTVDL